MRRGLFHQQRNVERFLRSASLKPYADIVRTVADVADVEFHVRLEGQSLIVP